MLKLCIKSIEKNSRYKHQVILHINEGVDGTFEWVKAQSLDHTYSATNAGVCYAVNAAAKLATTDYIVFMNDDMYVLPDWDHHLLEEIKAAPNKHFFFSSTMIEPEATGNPCVLAPYDYGRTPENFDEAGLLSSFSKLPFRSWQGSTWPPNVVHIDLWRKVGGYSEEFSPGMYSDPDFSMKLWQEGIRLFKGVSKSRVYHFMSKSTGKVIKNDGRRQFRQKWGISNSTFSKYYLRRGKPFSGPLSEPSGIGFQLKKLTDKRS